MAATRSTANDGPSVSVTGGTTSASGEMDPDFDSDDPPLINISLNPRYQGPEWAYAPTSAARLVDANGERVVDDVNFGDYFVLNGSVQYFLGEDLEHRLMIRLVNILDEDYYERASGGSALRMSRAGVRGEPSLS